MNTSPSYVSLNLSIHLKCPNGKSFIFPFEPCTDNKIYIQPIYNLNWSSTAVNTVVWTARSIDDQVSNFSAKWDDNDLLLLSWSGLNCNHNFKGWNLTEVLNNSSVLIPLGCSLLKDSTKNHEIRIKRNNTVICSNDIPHWEPILVHVQACVVYKFSLFPMWKERNKKDLIVQATAQPLLKGIIFCIFILLNLNLLL